MKVFTLRIDEKVDERIDQFSKENGINNKQEAYRRLLLLGLSQNTKYDKDKVIPLERETIKELKVIKNMLIDGGILDKEKALEIDKKVSSGVSKMNLIKEL